MSDLPERYTGLSKYLSYILRHHPEEADLELDEEGFASLEKVLSNIKTTKHSWASEEDIMRLINESEKTRFEIDGDKIRALYGHSVDVNLNGKTKPKSPLYHGTSPDSLEPIFGEGLKPMDRRYVHLSKTIKEAKRVGKRHSPDPVILRIDTEKAFEDGIRFIDREDVILSERIPPEYIYLENND